MIKVLKKGDYALDDVLIRDRSGRDVSQVVADIIFGVKMGGDPTLINYSQTFEGPIGGALELTKEEIDAAINAGADIVMLPYITSTKQVEDFLRYVDGRAKTMPLIETPQAVAVFDEILSLPGIDEIYIGLNDLSLGYHRKFMFELLADGTVESLCLKSKLKGIPYGFGGIASLGKGMLPSEYIIREHYRLGSSCAILSRSFCNVEKVKHIGIISSTFIDGVKAIRELEAECESKISYFRDNERNVTRIVQMICEG